ncbi:MAG TPA: hypothetical protein VFB80_04250 [Pirellulaceae bacterium]|nr:hypothetical protein [Pirellulaceae bacterium]
MLADLLMLAMALGIVLVPVIWMTRPLRLVNPYSQCGPRLPRYPLLTEATL